MVTRSVFMVIDMDISNLAAICGFLLFCEKVNGNITAICFLTILLL